mmetsp:Transcript_19467/g.48779  ORF Transcript_19467/g.48779 Transcript_19467/m.48779 type:complete len:235 (-) Transcript_19467:1199-1903(-)
MAAKVSPADFAAAAVTLALIPSNTFGNSAASVAASSAALAALFAAAAMPFCSARLAVTSLATLAEVAAATLVRRAAEARRAVGAEVGAASAAGAAALTSAVAVEQWMMRRRRIAQKSHETAREQRNSTGDAAGNGDGCALQALTFSVGSALRACCVFAPRPQGSFRDLSTPSPFQYATHRNIPVIWTRPRKSMGRCCPVSVYSCSHLTQKRIDCTAGCTRLLARAKTSTCWMHL